MFCYSCSLDIRVAMYFSWFSALLLSIAPTISQIAVIPAGTHVSAPGHDAQFQCQSLRGDEVISSVTWQANESFIDISNVEELFFGNAGFGILRLRNIQERLNMTRIRCIATLNSGGSMRTSPSTLLLLQGLPGIVTNLHLSANSSHITITWMPPTSLDVAEINYDDLTHCISVSIEDSMQPFCAISEAEFVYPLPPMTWCDNITFTVASINLAGRGPPLEIAYIPQVNASQIDRVQCTLVKNGDMGDIYEYTIIMNSPVCFAEVSLSSDNSTAHPNISIGSNNVTFTSQDLDHGRSYNVTVLASNAGGSATSRTNIRTSNVDVDIRNVGGVVEGLVSFCEGAAADGVLLSFLFVAEDGNVNFGKSILQVLDRNESLNHSLVLNYDGQYRIYVYDITDGGTFASGIISPSVIDTLSVTDGNRGATPQLQDLYIQSCDVSGLFDDRLKVKCVVSSDMVTGLQVIAQSTETADVGTLYTNHSSDPQATVTVQVGSTGMHQVSVFPILGERGILDTSAEHKEEVMVGDMLSQGMTTDDVITTATSTQVIDTEPPSNSIVSGIVVMVLVLVVVILVSVLVVLTMYVRRRRKGYKDDIEEYITLSAASPAIQEPQQSTPLLLTVTSQLSPEKGAPTPQLSPKEGAPIPQFSPEEGAPTPQLSPEEGAPTPQLSPKEGAPIPQFSPEEGAPTPQLSPEEGAHTPQLISEEGIHISPLESAYTSQLSLEEGAYFSSEESEEYTSTVLDTSHTCDAPGDGFASWDEMKTEIKKSLPSMDEMEKPLSDEVKDRIEKLLSSYVSQRNDWKEHKNYDKHKYTRNIVVHEDKLYDLIVLCWDSGQDSSIHDHAKSHCFMKILQGRLRETRYDWPTGESQEGGDIRPMKKLEEPFVYKTNDVAYINNSMGLHCVENDTNDDQTVSLHLYFPPIKMYSIFDERTGIIRQSVIH